MNRDLHGEVSDFEGNEEEVHNWGQWREKGTIGELGSVCVAASFGLVPG